MPTLPVAVVTPDLDEGHSFSAPGPRASSPARRRPLSASIRRKSPQRDAMAADTDRLSKTLASAARRQHGNADRPRPASALANSDRKPSFHSPEPKVPLLLMSRSSSRLGSSAPRPQSAGPTAEEFAEEGTPRSQGPELALQTLAGGPTADFFHPRRSRQHYVGVSDSAKEYNEIIGLLLEQQPLRGGQGGTSNRKKGNDGDSTLLQVLRRKQEQVAFDNTYQASINLIASIKGGGASIAADPVQKDEPNNVKSGKKEVQELHRVSAKKQQKSAVPVTTTKEKSGKAILARIERKVDEYRGDTMKRQELQHRVQYYMVERRSKFTKSYITDNIRNAAKWGEMQHEVEANQRAKHEQKIEEAKLRREIIEKLKVAKVLEQAALLKI